MSDLQFKRLITNKSQQLIMRLDNREGLTTLGSGIRRELRVILGQSLIYTEGSSWHPWSHAVRRLLKAQVIVSSFAMQLLRFCPSTRVLAQVPSMIELGKAYLF